jgi:hypothetical protein
VTRHLLLSTAIALLAVGLALVSGVHRRGALVGAVSSGITGVASLLFMQRGARAKKPVQAALIVMAAMFLVRIVLVALGTVVVARAGESIFAFVTAFFVPYFTFAAIEGSYLHGLNRGTGPTS